MAKLRRQIAEMAKARDTKRGERRRHQVPAVAIAAYTNAGKSSLLNRLTGAGVLVEDALFATLDPTVRRAETPGGRAYTLADTVGFVRHLPHQLIEAFRSTLEEVTDAGLILHVVDGSDPDPEAQIDAVREVLREIDAAAIPEIIVINKADAADDLAIARLQRREPHSVVVSARTGFGIESCARPSRRICRGWRANSTSSCRTSAATSSRGCMSAARCSSRSTSPRAPSCTRACLPSSRASSRSTRPPSRRRPGSRAPSRSIGWSPGKPGGQPVLAWCRVCVRVRPKLAEGHPGRRTVTACPIRLTDRLKSVRS